MTEQVGVMLDPKMVDLIDRMVRVQLDERAEQLPREISIIHAKAASHGMGTSGPVLEQIFDLCAHDIEIRTLIVWQNLRRVLLETGITPSQSLAQDLKDLVARYTPAIMSVPSEQYARVAQAIKIDLRVSLNDALTRAMSKVNAEIDLLILSLSRRIEAAPDRGSPQPVFHFYSGVGAIQTGPSATATIVMNIGAEDREILLRALDRVKVALAGVESLPACPKAEIIDLVDEVKSEVEKPKPNGTRLGSLASAIATAIQTVGSLQPAYQALKAALLPLGILLP